MFDAQMNNLCRRFSGGMEIKMKKLISIFIVALAIFTGVTIGTTARVQASEEDIVEVGSFGFDYERIRTTIPAPSRMHFVIADVYCTNGEPLDLYCVYSASMWDFIVDIRWNISGHLPDIDELVGSTSTGRTLIIGKDFTPRVITVTAYRYSNPAVYSTIDITVDPYMPIIIIDEDVMRLTSGNPQRITASFTMRNVPIQDSTLYIFTDNAVRDFTPVLLFDGEESTIVNDNWVRTQLFLEERICPESVTQDGFVITIDFYYNGHSAYHERIFGTRVYNNFIAVPLGYWIFGHMLIRLYTPDGRQYVHGDVHEGIRFVINSPKYTPSRWARHYLEWAISSKFVPDNLQNNFTQPITRAEFAALGVLYYERAHDEIIGRTTFIDTTDINVEKLAYLGVISGVGGGRFNPDAPITREQAAVLLARLSEVAGRPLTAATADFADNANISSWAIDYVGKVQAAEIMDGIGNNIFSPQGVFSREQSIVTIFRMTPWDWLALPPGDHGLGLMTIVERPWGHH